MKRTCGRPGSKASRLSRSIGLVLTGLMLAGCPAGRQAAGPSAPARVPGKLVIRGSNTIGEELGPRLITEFKKDHQGADIDLQAKATGYGLADLRVGTCDIAAASRPATKDEVDEARHMGVEMSDHVIGAYSVSVVVNQKNAVTNLTREQVRDIFTGKVTNWKDVGGADAAIHPYVRDPVSGTYLGFKELAMENQNYCEGRRLATSYKEITQDVGQDESGIGYATIELPKDAPVKSVSIGGVPAAAATVNSGAYPYARVLHLYTNKSKEDAASRDFVQFVLSAHGQEIVSQMGFTPHP
jgi:phosphate transport system substrate-binding protein